jgi:hypothetical protein
MGPFMVSSFSAVALAGGLAPAATPAVFATSAVLSVTSGERREGDCAGVVFTFSLSVACVAAGAAPLLGKLIAILKNSFYGDSTTNIAVQIMFLGIISIKTLKNN